ncbi:Acetoacetyl-CoA reductase [Ralstonia pseudosolanacearum FQY_4]|nr:Acetoacetyl-CoA reductase [Ralstonia pseudosolanacearum FQY_4]
MLVAMQHFFVSECKNSVLYLCSEDAAYVTGSNIGINGGQHMQ